MIEFSAIILQIIQGLLNAINQLVGILLSVGIFNIPLLVFIATFDFLFFLILKILGEDIVND